MLDEQASECRMSDTRYDTPRNLPSQQEVQSTCAKNEHGGESVHMAAHEDEGQRLDQALAARGLNRSKLAKRAGVSASTCQKWYDALSRGDITDSMWQSCANALRIVGIDPREVRPGAEDFGNQQSATSLVDPIMSIHDQSTLRLLFSLLTIEDRGQRAMLLAIVNSKIARP